MTKSSFPLADEEIRVRKGGDEVRAINGTQDDRFGLEGVNAGFAQFNAGHAKAGVPAATGIGCKCFV